MAGLAVAQALWLPRRTRWMAGTLDGLLVAAAVSLLARRVPVGRWPAVLDYAGLAMVEWHRGYLEGLPRS
jgi:hypothetical protein